WYDSFLPGAMIARRIVLILSDPFLRLLKPASQQEAPIVQSGREKESSQRLYFYLAGLILLQNIAESGLVGGFFGFFAFCAHVVAVSYFISTILLIGAATIKLVFLCFK